MNAPRSKLILPILNFCLPILIFCTLLPFLPGSAMFVTPAYAAGITVNSNADTIADDGTCTLREALANANGDSQLYASAGECAAGSGNDTITFDSSLSGVTIYLTSTLTLSDTVTIDGSALASKITLSGDSNNDGTGDVRVFHTTGHNLVTVALDSLIITKGFVSDEGGGLLNNATTTITNSIFDGNTATNGGAISTLSALTIISSTFSGNSSTDPNGGGGAIINNYTLMIRGSTFSGNSANASSGSGGAIYNVASGEIYNSTFSGNSAAGGGAILTTQPLTIKNSTLSGNSALITGGLAIEGHTTNLANTIIANNSASFSDDDCTNDSTIGTNTNNLIEDGSCSPTLSGDPNLGALASNGGPTQTFALLAGSSAINAGDDTTCTNAPISDLDQRGLTRTSNGPHCDIGAYEYQDSTAPTVVSSVRANASPTNAVSVNFTVTFSESVTGVDTSDFNLTKTGITGGSITGVIGSGAIYTVTVNTGAGSGTLRLNVKASGTGIQDVAGNPLSGGFTTGETYTIEKIYLIYLPVTRR